MKRILCLLLIVICSISALHAKSDDYGKGIIVEVGISRDHNKVNTFYNESYAVLSPKVGFRFNKRLIVGLAASISLDKGDYIIGVNNHYGVFAEYNVWYKRGFYIFLTGEISHVHQKDHFVVLDGIYPGVTVNLPKIHSATEVGLTPGIGYKIPKVGIDVKIRYGFIGYNDMRNPWERYVSVRDIDGCLTRGDFMLDGSSRRLQLSIGYTFGW